MLGSRRAFLTTTIAGGYLAGPRLRPAVAQSAVGNNEFGVKALFFDMFGTVVDWRTGVAREAEAHLKPRGYNLDWFAFADAWRAGYGPATEEVTSGRIPFAKLDVLHRKILDSILPRFNIKDLPDDVAHSLNMAWHRLDVWPDVTASLPRLEKKFLLAPVSNGHIALTVDLDRRNNLHFDAILGSELAQDYKPKPHIYLAAVEAFELQPNECLMVSASGHTGDIKGAAAAGLRTASVARPDEFGPGTQPSVPKTHADIVVGSLIELADKLGA
jgi:2-haloacid dehalogenase